MLKGGIEQTHFQGYVFRVLQIFRDVARWSMSPCPAKLWCRCVPPFTQRCCPGWFRWMPKMICWIFTPGIRKRMCQKWAFWGMVPIGSLGFVGSNFDPFQNSPRSPVWRGWKDSPFPYGQLCWFCSRPECQTTRVRSPHLPDVLITGHSLGGGVAALLAALWRVSWLFLRSLWLAGSLEVSLLSRKFSITPSDFVDILDRKGMEGLIANMSNMPYVLQAYANATPLQICRKQILVELGISPEMMWPFKLIEVGVEHPIHSFKTITSVPCEPPSSI